MSSRRSPLEIADLLAEILLRLPPQPSSLPRASAVCKRWRLLVSDPRFRRRFHIHHRRNPPLLGCFVEKSSSLSFLPTMEAPNRLPRGRLCMQFGRDTYFLPLGCRHGLALIYLQRRQKFLVWDPVTGDQHQLAMPRGFVPTWTPQISGSVLRAAGDVHFQVVLVATGAEDTEPGLRALAYLYSSETGLWGDLISTPIPFEPNSDADFLFWASFYTSVSTTPSVLVGDSFYWLLCGYSLSILEFDFGKQSLAVIGVPEDVSEHKDSFTVIRADGGGLGILTVSKFTAQLWERNTDCDGVASWVLVRTIELDKLLCLDSEVVPGNTMILGFAEEKNTVILWTAIGVFAVQLQSLQFKKLPKFNITFSYYPFESVYTADICSEHGGGELLSNA